MIDLVATIWNGTVGTAAVGYFVSQYQKAREKRVRRDSLLELLGHELDRVDLRVPEYGSSVVGNAHPPLFSSIRPLLDGQTLTFHKDRQIICALLNLQAALQAYGTASGIVIASIQATASAAITNTSTSEEVLSVVNKIQFDMLRQAAERVLKSGEEVSHALTDLKPARKSRKRLQAPQAVVEAAVAD